MLSPTARRPSSPTRSTRGRRATSSWASASCSRREVSARPAGPARAVTSCGSTAAELGRDGHPSSLDDERNRAAITEAVRQDEHLVAIGRLLEHGQRLGLLL